FVSLISRKSWMLESSLRTLLSRIAHTEDSLRLYSNADERKLRGVLYLCRPTLGSVLERKEKREMGRENARRTVASLREEWDRSEAATSQRRRQLEGLASDSGRSLDDRRRELEAWLARMEARLDRQGVAGPGHSLEALEAQLREQRAAVDSVTRLAHKAASEPRANAMTVPMQEDSARLVAAVENINQRFADLSLNVQSRGQALQSALSSLQQMEKALDRFLVWLADSEATLDVLETEADRYGPRDD
ncbi:hypothetical protein IscW_ISCW001116, partial [Ixodes scapularis]